MIDKIKLKKFKLDKDPRQVIGLLDGEFGHVFRTPDKFYEYSYVLEDAVSGRYVIVSYSPKFSNASGLTIELNPSRFKSLNDLVEFVSLFGSVSDFEISRIDFNSDIIAPFSEVFRFLIVQNKMSRDVFSYGNQRCGVVFGNKPEVIIVYDKAFELSQKIKYRFKHLKGQSPDQLTRFEVRNFKNTVKVKSFEDIHEYVDVNPFEKIRSYSLKDVPELKPRSLGLYLKFLELLNEDGLHHARKELGQGGNFSSVYEKYLTDQFVSDQLFKQHKRELKEFISG